MQKGGYCEFSTPMRPTTGGNLDDAFLERSLKTERLRRLTSVGVLGQTKKFSNLSHTIKYASTPRKLRSALEKRAPGLPDSRKEIDRFERRLKECTKKHKTATDEHKDSKLCLITKDEEEAAQALFALAQTFNETCMNKASDMEPSSVMVPPTQTEETDVKNVLQKRCLVHVYICHFIKVVQTAESEGGHVNVISDTKSVCSYRAGGRTGNNLSIPNG